jgi:hypothetical protein
MSHRVKTLSLLMLALLLSACMRESSSTDLAIAPTSTHVPAPPPRTTPTAQPRRLAPTRTPRPTRTPVPSLPTLPPATNTPVVDTLPDEIESVLSATGFTASVVRPIADAHIVVDVFDTQPLSILNEDLHGIAMLHHVESQAYLVLYTILHDFQDVDRVTIRSHVDDVPVYETNATRTQAYDFPPEGLDLSVAPDAMMLSASAEALRVGRAFDTTLIAEELQNAVNNPDTESIKGELENWMSNPDDLTVVNNENAIVVTSDISELFDLYFDADQQNSPAAQEWIEDRASMEIIHGIGALMDRFPALQSVTIEVAIHTNVALAYRCTREQFNAIGSEPFIMAATLEEFKGILKNLTILP